MSLSNLLIGKSNIVQNAFPWSSAEEFNFILLYTHHMDIPKIKRINMLEQTKELRPPFAQMKLILKADKYLLEAPPSSS